VRRGDEDLLHEILFLGAHAYLAAAAPALAPVEAHGIALNIAGVGDRHDHILFDDKVFDIDVVGADHDLRSPVIAVPGPDVLQFSDDDLQDPVGMVENVLQIGDLFHQFRVFGVDFFPFQPGETLEAHLQDRPGLGLREAEAGAQGHGGLLGIRGRLDDGHHRVDIVQGDDESRQDVGPFRGFGQLEAGPADDDLLAEVDEALENFLEIENPGLLVVDGQHDDAEGRFHLGVLVKLVEDDAGNLVPLQVQDHPDAVPVRFVPEIGDALDLLLLDEFRYLLDKIGLIYLVGKFRNDDALPVVPGVALDHGPGADPDAPPAGAVSGEDALPAVDESRRREVRPGDVADEFFDGQLGIADQGDRPIDHLPEIVRGDVRRHPHGDAGGAVEKNRGDLGRHDQRFHKGFIVIGREIDRVLFEIRQNLFGDSRHADLGVTHRRRRVAVQGAEVALAVHE